ncbi:hypothetical protein [Paraflavitalea speifideaquila]|uniref:hypothetical protein n=1 Tax=Paraflavitalea speifideaquila TaxID=3076558 RepID=UPI0028EE633C|nr:hypothetical protein [Paraflavitalea speifideiaquila]
MIKPIAFTGLPAYSEFRNRRHQPAPGRRSTPFGPLLKNDFKEIEKVTRILPAGTMTLRYQDKVFNEQHVVFADEEFFNLFTVQVSSGNKASALKDPNTILLTEELAKSILAMKIR